MQSTKARRWRAVLFAVALALGGASPALAAEVTSTTTETLTVSSTISMVGVPATLTYPSVNAGLESQAPEFVVGVASNHASGWTLKVTASDFTSGGNSIVNTARSYGVAGNGTLFDFTAGKVAYTGSPRTLASKTSGGDADVFITSYLDVPSATVPGDYSGSAVFTASTNP